MKLDVVVTNNNNGASWDIYQLCQRLVCGDSTLQLIPTSMDQVTSERFAAVIPRSSPSDESYFGESASDSTSAVCVISMSNKGAFQNVCECV